MGLVELAGLIRSATWATGARSLAGPVDGPGANVEKLGQSLFSSYLLPFEVTSALLVIAVVAPVVLARRPRPGAESPRGRDRGRGPRRTRERVTMTRSRRLVPERLAAVLFSIGAVGLLVRRNVLVMFMCVELMLNAVNLTFVTFARMLDDIGGQSIVFFVLVVAAAEVVVGLGIIVAIFRRRAGATADDLHILKG